MDCRKIGIWCGFAALVVVLVTVAQISVAGPQRIVLVLAQGSGSEPVDAQELVLAAMHALWDDRDIERHLAYMADDVVVHGIRPSAVFTGKDEYRQELLPMGQAPEELWQFVEVHTTVTGVTFDAPSNTTMVEIEMVVRHSGQWAGTPDQFADCTFLVRDDLIHEMHWRSRPSYRRTFTY